MAQDVYDKVMTLAKRRGFIYPSFEIYGGSAGFYDYGPLGTRLKHNIENIWRKFFLLKDNCYEITTPTITLYEVLKASGHVDEFTDLTVECSKCKQSFKVEDIIKDGLTPEQEIKKNKVKCPNCGMTLKDAKKVNLMFKTKIGIGNTRKAFLRPETAQGIFVDFHLLYRYAREKLPFGIVQMGKGYRNEVSPRQGVIRLREFSMAEAEVFFDPEDKSHPNFHEYRNGEIALFDNKKNMKISLNDAVKKKIVKNQALAYYMYLTQKFLLDIGVDPSKFRFRKHAEDELAHYAQECWDAEIFSKRFGWIECVGIADRSAYDLSSHIESTDNDMRAMRKYDNPKNVKLKKIVPDMGFLGPIFKEDARKIKEILENMEVKESDKLEINLNGKKIKIPKKAYKIIEKEEKITVEKFVPHVIEPSFGIDRIFYCILEHNFEIRNKDEEEYRILKLKPIVAPIKVGVFPLIKDERLIKIASKIDKSLRNAGIYSYYDISGSIGRRYARMDEAGTPFCITVDHDTIKDETVTIRERDSAKQIRLKMEKIKDFILKKIG